MEDELSLPQAADAHLQSPCGGMLCRRLHRGEDLLLALTRIAAEERLASGVILSGVGCVTRARVRDASGVTIREIDAPCEIVSLNGTLSQDRCHVHIALAKEDLSVIGGHLVEGCIVNTTCELVIARVPGWTFLQEADAQTGYDEIVFCRA